MTNNEKVLPTRPLTEEERAITRTQGSTDPQGDRNLLNRLLGEKNKQNEVYTGYGGEKLIQEIMNKLGVSRQEAIQIAEENFKTM